MLLNEEYGMSFPELYFDKKRGDIVSSLSNISIVRRRYNYYYQGGQRFRRPREVALDDPVVYSSGWNTITDYIHVRGTTSKGKVREYQCMLYTKENLDKVRKFIEENG
jgi:hypothetical protein